MGSLLWFLILWSWNFYKCQIFDGVPPVVADSLVLKFFQVSDFRWGPPCGFSFSGLEIFTSVRFSIGLVFLLAHSMESPLWLFLVDREIFTSVRFSMGSPLWLLFGWSWNFYKCQIFDGVPPVVAIWLVVKFSDFRWGPPCWNFTLPIRWGPPCWFFSLPIRWGPPCGSIWLVVKFLQVFVTVATAAQPSFQFS